MARGNYNQDLTPLNLLLEVGAHTNSSEAAEAGIALFADAVALYFYGPEGERAAQTPPGALQETGNRSALRSILFLLGATGAIIIGFVLLNTGRLNSLQTTLEPLLGKARGRIEQGDRYLQPWQEKIRGGSLTARDKLLKIPSQFRRK